MSFLNPMLLFGLAAVTVPIIIHLLNRRRFRKVAWAAMRFLQLSIEQNQRRMRIEDMILLALRCLLVALLALALARPAFLSQAAGVFGGSKATAAILLDNSYSMGMSDGATRRFDQARRAAEQALDSLPPGSASAVLLASDIVRGVIPEPTFDLNLARKAIRDAPLSDRATDLFPAVNQTVAMLRDRLAVRKEIFLVTDGQAAGWRQFAEIQTTLERAKNELSTYLILVGDSQEHNLGISDLRLAGGLTPVKQPLRFQVKVTNFGTEEVRDVPVTLQVNNDPPGDEFTIRSLAPGASQSLSLFARFQTEGYHAVTARIPADRLPADDHRTVIAHAIKEARVLLVDGDPGNEPRESEVFFMKHALAPVAPEQAEDYFIKTVTITPAELPTAGLDAFDALVLANVPQFSDGTLAAVEQYLRRGGGLILFPGGRVDTAFYNEQLFQRAQLLPAPMGAPRGDAGQDQNFWTLQEKDYQHPVVAIWNDPAAGSLGSARFFRAFELTLPQPAAAGTPTNNVAATPQPREAGEPGVVLKYADGRPAVMERAWGLGKVVLFSSTADTAWNDWPVRLSFVPLMHRTLGSIIERQDENLNVRVGAKFSRRISAEFLDKNATVTRPGQGAALRDLRRVELAAGWPMLQYEMTDDAGVYEARVTDPPLVMKFAAQPDPSESSLEMLSPAQRQRLQSVARVIPWTPNLVLKNQVEKDRTGLEFWLPLMLAALLAAGVETYLSQRFSIEK